MKTLIIDTSTNVMYISLADNNKLIDEKIRISKKDISKYLVSEIKHLLDNNHTSLDSIDKIIVGRGPGSYTGLRIAGTVAKTLAYTKDIDLYEISSLYLLTSGYESVVAMIDARNNFVFGAIYINDEVIVDDGHFLKEDLLNKKQGNELDILIDETNYKIDIGKVINKSSKVSNVHEYVPNYINKTEAERNNENK